MVKIQWVLPIVLLHPTFKFFPLYLPIVGGIMSFPHYFPPPTLMIQWVKLMRGTHEFSHWGEGGWQWGKLIEKCVSPISPPSTHSLNILSHYLPPSTLYNGKNLSRGRGGRLISFPNLIMRVGLEKERGMGGKGKCFHHCLYPWWENEIFTLSLPSTPSWCNIEKSQGPHNPPCVLLFSSYQ